MPYWHLDAAMASLLILQTAVDEGLGACFFGIPPDRVPAFREEFRVPLDHALGLGHRPVDVGLVGAAAAPRLGDLPGVDEVQLAVRAHALDRARGGRR